jgi:uncharacterized protein with HEPN domain
MSFSNLDLLKHILDEVDFILKASDKKVSEDVINDAVLSRAIIRSLEIVGEASKKLNDEFKVKYPSVEWRKLAGTRDKLIHDYFGVDYEIVWDIIENKLPQLRSSIIEIIDLETR